MYTLKDKSFHPSSKMRRQRKETTTAEGYIYLTGPPIPPSQLGPQNIEGRFFIRLVNTGFIARPREKRGKELYPVQYLKTIGTVIVY